MTVCISGICNNRSSIVCATDSKITFTGFSADNIALKNRGLCKNWYVLIAGDDVEHAKPIGSKAEEIINEVDGAWGNPGLVSGALMNAYTNRLHQEIEAKVLSKRGFTLETFRDHGKNKCTPDVYIDLCSRIDQVRLSLTFMLYGFGELGQPHIFCVDGKSVAKCYDDIGMWAIGSGGPAALSALAFHAEREDFHPLFSSEEETVYFLLAAKFMSESAPMVGKSTFATVLRYDEGTKELGRAIVPTERVEQIRHLWQREGAPRKPKKMPHGFIKDI